MAKDHSDNDMKPAAIFNDALKTLFTVIWCHQTYGKGSLRCQERIMLLPHGQQGFFYMQDNTYHSLCYTSHGAMAGMRNSLNGSIMRDRSNDPSHRELHLTPIPFARSAYNNLARIILMLYVVFI